MDKLIDDKITVHIADDHQILIDGIMAVLELEQNIEVVGYSLNGRQVLDWFHEHSADVLVLDRQMTYLYQKGFGIEEIFGDSESLRKGLAEFETVARDARFDILFRKSPCL